MREYELIYIIHPDLDENALKEITERVNGWITEGGGQVVKADFWGKRQLAYPIKKHKEGQYVYVHTNMPPALTAVLERNIRLTEPILRFMITSI
ncbi:MAG: 30S ribosomal protein S6 [Anaerolineales bacterium]|nr:30S ribosomal protein S6 [Anaerolineales bacterium]